MTALRWATVIAFSWAAAAALVVAWNHAVTSDDELEDEQTAERLSRPFVLPRRLP